MQLSASVSDAKTKRAADINGGKSFKVVNMLWSDRLFTDAAVTCQKKAQSGAPPYFGGFVAILRDSFAGRDA